MSIKKRKSGKTHLRQITNECVTIYKETIQEKDKEPD